MRPTPLLAALALLAALPAAAQDRTASAGREGVFYFRADAQTARTTLYSPLEVVWRALPLAYKELGFQLDPTADTLAHEFRTPFMQIRGQLYTGEPNSRYFECSRNSLTGPAADQGDITFAMLTHLEADPSGTTVVLTQMQARLKRRDSSQYPIDCASTGRLEQMLAQYLVQHARQAGEVEVRRRTPPR
jgi:hypothetical protein